MLHWPESVSFFTSCFRCKLLYLMVVLSHWKTKIKDQPRQKIYKHQNHKIDFFIGKPFALLRFFSRTFDLWLLIKKRSTCHNVLLLIPTVGLRKFRKPPIWLIQFIDCFEKPYWGISGNPLAHSSHVFSGWLKSAQMVVLCNY